MSDLDFPNVPDFKDLPPVEGMPQGCAWGVFDKPPHKDTIGTLNFLTPAVIRAAYASELRTGHSVSLDLPLEGLALPTKATGRRSLAHMHINWKTLSNGTLNAWDDELHFNTQGSSQWDSLLHFPHQPTGLCYNGAKPTSEALAAVVSGEGSSTLPTLDRWHDRGGVVARGVLLDYRAWAVAKGVVYSVHERHVITVEALEEVAAWQGTELRRGDVLLVRTGWVEDMLALRSAEKRAEAMKSNGGATVGVEGTKRAAAWFWNKRFAGVAADNPGFEVVPPAREDGSLAEFDELVLHSYFLCFFGLHIGEMWALKGLAEHCVKEKRYSFLLTSTPLNVPGLIGSPPNALALS